MKLVKDDGSLRTGIRHRFDIWIPHIHGNCPYRITLFLRQGYEKVFYCFNAPSFETFAQPYDFG
jgi:hypothetical protein